jgi:methylmalonyl-CoA mutase C-terminal domain/subunit
MEVIYTGLHQTPEMIVEAAIQEDVDCIGVSILSGAHMAILPKILELLKKSGADHIALLGGGIIPEEDARQLERLGVKKLFGPGTPTREIADFIKGAIKC